MIETDQLVNTIQIPWNTRITFFSFFSSFMIWPLQVAQFKHIYTNTFTIFFTTTIIHYHTHDISLSHSWYFTTTFMIFFTFTIIHHHIHDISLSNSWFFHYHNNSLPQLQYFAITFMIFHYHIHDNSLLPSQYVHHGYTLFTITSRDRTAQAQYTDRKHIERVKNTSNFI